MNGYVHIDVNQAKNYLQILACEEQTKGKIYP
jgi:hypothetical protein